MKLKFLLIISMLITYSLRADYLLERVRFISDTDYDGNSATNVYRIYFTDGTVLPGSNSVQIINRGYPVIKLALNGEWTDFELKASTNNFRTLCYHIFSTRAMNDVIVSNDGIGNYSSDPGREIYYTDDISITNTTRRLVRLPKTRGIAEDILINNNLTDLPVDEKIRYVLVTPNHSTAENADDWMWEDEVRLSWIYLKMNDSKYETGPDGKPKWNICYPLSWKKELLRLVEEEY